jgi:hypothetical protein
MPASVQGQLSDPFSARALLGLGSLATVQTLVGLTVSNQTLYSGTKYYGNFYDTTTQFISTIDEIKVIGINSTAGSNGITCVGGTKLTVDNAGVYNVQISVQLANSSAATNDASIWFKKNGQPVADSASIIAIHGKRGAVEGHTILAMNFILTLAAADYVELFWSADDTGIHLQYYAGTPPIPNAPSIIVTLTQL